MKYTRENDVLTISLKGRIDSANAAEIERELNGIRTANPSGTVVLDCENLEFLSSAGLRVVLRIKKSAQEAKLINVSDAVYDILDITGFTEMMEIERAYREISVEGCEIIGQGANGTVYRFNADTVVKVYRNPEALPEIRRERELARTAFVLGVPTAIPYMVVRIKGGGYGSVFELLNATNFAKLLIRGIFPLEKVAEMSIELLRIIHGTEVKPDSMPSMREVAIGWADDLKGHLSIELFQKLYRLIEAVPEDFHMLHGDYHIRNITRQGDENLILDMDTLSHGHPVFELASMYNAYCGFSDPDHEAVKRFLGIDRETSVRFWRKSLELYLGTTDEQTVRNVEDKAKVVGYMRLMRRCIRRNGYETEAGKKAIACYRALLCELLPRVDSLVF